MAELGKLYAADGVQQEDLYKARDIDMASCNPTAFAEHARGGHRPSALRGADSESRRVRVTFKRPAAEDDLPAEPSKAPKLANTELNKPVEDDEKEIPIVNEQPIMKKPAAHQSLMKKPSAIASPPTPPRVAAHVMFFSGGPFPIWIPG